jgi:hypothetical protein
MTNASKGGLFVLAGVILFITTFGIVIGWQGAAFMVVLVVCATLIATGIEYTAKSTHWDP